VTETSSRRSRRKISEYVGLFVGMGRRIDEVVGRVCFRVGLRGDLGESEGARDQYTGIPILLRRLVCGDG
jgi:hypothetical protein